MESTVDIVHAAQWAALRAWVDTVPATARRQPSVLDGWTVDDLLSHLARTVDAIAALRPVASHELVTAAGVPDRRATGDPGVSGSSSGDQGKGQDGNGGNGTDRSVGTGTGDDGDDVTLLTIADYLGGFADGKQETAEKTRRAAAASTGDRGGELDAAFAQSQRTLSALGMSDPLVKVRGGIMQLSDFLETRVIELVVHAGDLHRSLPDLPISPPLLPAAVDRVDRVLRQVFLKRAGVLGGDTAVARTPAEDFIAVAAGRIEPPEQWPSAVRSEFPLF